MIKKMLRLLPDRVYIQILYFYHFKKFANLRNPEGFNEKMQWLKLHDHNPVYTKMVDKIEAKKYVASLIGDEYIIPTFAEWDNVDDIDFSVLPNQFVLKSNHDSGSLIICKDKKELDIEKAKRKMATSYDNNGYWYGREWPYKNVKPRFLAEQYMEDEETRELRDYKFFCFDGQVKALFIGSDRQKPGESVKFDFFDEEFNHLDFTNGHPNSSVLPKKPHNFELMKELATQLSKGFPFLRVDLYEVNGKVYFGELTLYHGSGCLPFNPNTWDKVFGSWLTLPNRL